MTSSLSVDNGYGSVTKPSSFGSGNGFFKGGGIVNIEVDGSVRIDGLMSVDGGSVGGSGGSIYIKSSSFSGQGQLSAKGGNGNSSLGKIHSYLFLLFSHMFSFIHSCSHSFFQ